MTSTHLSSEQTSHPSDGVLAGRVALVTGGSRGIGAAVARRLARDGAFVGITYLQAEEPARTVAKEIEADGGRAIVIQADLTDPASAVDAVDRTVAEFGRIDILVNNAGYLAYAPLEDVTPEDLARVLAVDVAAPVLAARAAAEHFGEGGRIITVGSCFNGRVPGANFVLQATAKAALVGYTKALARELGPRGVNVTMVDPGPIDTDMNPADGESADFQRGLTALGQYGHVDDIAGAVSFLAGPGGRFVTGASLPVDGGFTA